MTSQDSKTLVIDTLSSQLARVKQTDGSHCMKAQPFKLAQFFLILLSLLLFVGCGSGSPTASTINSDPSLSIIGVERSQLGDPVDCSTCCRRCVTGKACGNSCINVNLECHQPPGCACNKVEDSCYLPAPDPCAPSVERSLSSADPAFYTASCPSADCVANNNLGDIADSFISRCRKASIRQEFPGELLNETLGNIKAGNAANYKKAWKLLNDRGFLK